MVGQGIQNIVDRTLVEIEQPPNLRNPVFLLFPIFKKIKDLDGSVYGGH
jgi:hypothetical protein